MNLFLNLLVCNVIERKIKKEKVQMKPPHDFLTLNYSTAVRWRKKINVLGFRASNVRDTSIKIKNPTLTGANKECQDGVTELNKKL